MKESPLSERVNPYESPRGLEPRPRRPLPQIVQQFPFKWLLYGLLAGLSFGMVVGLLVVWEEEDVTTAVLVAFWFALPGAMLGLSCWVVAFIAGRLRQTT